MHGGNQSQSMHSFGGNTPHHDSSQSLPQQAPAESPLRNTSISSPDLYVPGQNSSLSNQFQSMASLDARQCKLAPASALTAEPEQTDQGLDLEKVVAHFERQARSAGSPRPFSRPSAPVSTPRFTFYSEKTGVIRSSYWNTLDISLDQGRDVRNVLTEGTFWIDVSCPTAQEMDDISQVFGLHPLTNEDIQTPDTREKCEVFSKYYFVVIRSFEQDQYKPTFLQPITVYIIIFDECIITFHSAANPHSRNVRSRIDQLASYGDVSITTEWINYALIDDITDSFIPLMKIIEMEVDAVEEIVLIPVLKNDYVDMDMLRRIGMVRKRVVQLLRLISTKVEVMKTIINRYMNQQGETRFYLEDIHDHIATMMQNLGHYEQSLARSHSNYLAQISIDITQASNRTSDTVMRMTLLASILVPLNVITGLFGMK
ncbi:CorA metal ion transporter [Kappamyces sp. JEL0680]|nr:CorA metal ion transporter [Kappamyces sp. JEL0680]